MKNITLCMVALWACCGSAFTFHHPIQSRLGAHNVVKLSRPLSYNQRKSVRYAGSKASANGKSNAAKAYGAEQIVVLEGLDPVRKRPGMYIGSTGSKGLHHLVNEIVDNSVDEAMAGFCDCITVTIHEDNSISVNDNGRGIPCETHPQSGKSTLETVLTVLHAGGKFGGKTSGYTVSGGLHGVGASVVNALSEQLTVEVTRDAKVHKLSFAKGNPTSSLAIGKAPRTASGTLVHFKPDPEIFKETTEFDANIIASRLDELAYLNPGLRLLLHDKRSNAAGSKKQDTSDSNAEDKQQNGILGAPKLSGPGPFEFVHRGGLTDLVHDMTNKSTPLYSEVEIITATKEKKGVSVDVALRWTRDSYSENIIGFANGIRTRDGGTHIDGLKAAISKTVNAAAKKLTKQKEPTSNLPGEFIREGLTAVINVKVPEPEFEGQTKTRLGNPEVRAIVDAITADVLSTTFEWNPSVLQAIYEKACQAQAAATAAKSAREQVRKKSLLASTVLPGKLADCVSSDPSECEIYIVEGDSAAGSAKQGRNRQTQAILPLRGKILNTEKANGDKILKNAELQALVSALGLGRNNATLDEAALRYHRIVLMTDADVDGAHIRILLLTFLYRYHKLLVERGHVYIACPPLFKVTQGRGFETYVYTQEELDSLIASRPPSPQISIQRFKGLGEMMPEQLWQTTMNPATRTLKKVTIEDAEAADAMFATLMGDSVAARKEFISTNAATLNIQDLDI